MKLRVYRQAVDKAPQGVLTRATGQIVVEEDSPLRIEIWNGKEYTVVPVVAIVEGVLQGANSTGPEYATAEEFGRFPAAWNGRPVVMNHPQIDGVFVSAGIPEVLEDYGMGMIFNSHVENKKLKCEAWLDHARIEEIGGELLSTLERIRNNEMVEVSVGAYLTVNKVSGVYEGKSYVGKWSNVAPDHLAFLSEGVQGACSIKDGCGVPRLLSVNHATIGAQASCCDACSEGRACEAAPAEEGDDVEELTAVQHRSEMFQAFMKELCEGGTTFEVPDINVNQIPDGMELGDLKVIVWQGLLEKLDVCSYDIDLAAWTTDAVVYYQWGRRGLHMRTYTVDADGNIEFSADDVPVNLLTKIMPRQTNQLEPSAQENTMSGNQTGNTPASAAEGVSTETTANGGTGEQENAQGELTLEALLANASPELRESISESMSVHASMKAKIVADLVACERNTFDEATLKQMPLTTLKGLASLAQLPNYAGVALPTEAEGVTVHSRGGAKIAAAPTNYLAKTAE